MLKLSNLIGFGGTGVTGTSTGADDFFVWGSRAEGQVGDGVTSGIPIDTPIQIGSPLIISIPSSSFSLSLSMGYLIGGVLSTVGDNSYGQLGLNDDVDKSSFTTVTVAGSPIVDFAFGRDHSLTVRNGKVNGCGRNNQNQLTDSSAPSFTYSIIVQPAAIGGANAMSVYASEFSSAVLTSTNDVYVWGASVGALAGSGSTIDEPQNIDEFTADDSLAEKSIVDFAIGTSHCLALDSDGVLYSMSDSNSYGQAGIGSVGSGETNTQIVFSEPNITKIACGSRTSYVIAGGKLFGCGRGDSGELGENTAASQNPDFFELDTSIDDWINVQAGDGFVIAQTQDGTLHHSGSNQFGQQGNDVTGGDIFGFVQIDGGVPPAKIYRGFSVSRRNVYGLV